MSNNPSFKPIFVLLVLFSVLAVYVMPSQASIPSKAYLLQTLGCENIIFPYTLTGANNAERVANLNKAIDCANSNASDDLIDLDGQTLTLLAFAESLSPADQNGLKVIRSGITIRNGEILREPVGDLFRFFNVQPGAHLQLDRITLRNAYHFFSLTEGGAIANYGTLTINNSTFTGNTSGHGGAIYNGSQGTLYLNNSVITGNYAYNFGGGISNYNLAYINNSTIAGNYAGLSSGGLFIDSGNVTINNTLIAGNDSPGILNLQGSYTGSHNLIDGDAKFINLVKAGSSGATSAGDYHLDQYSPAIDAGSNSLVPNGLNHDRDGNPRFFDDYGASDVGEGSAPVIDIGAYERQSHSPYQLVDLDISITSQQTSVSVGDRINYTIRL